MAEREAGPSLAQFSFEGDFIDNVEGKLPAMTLEMPEAYSRGTILRLAVEVRVRSVRHEEDRKGNLVRQHIFALESVNLLGSHQPEDVQVVEGSASAAAQQDEDDEDTTEDENEQYPWGPAESRVVSDSVEVGF